MALHSDPYASHYLKILLDAVFGVKNFRNEIIWYYTNSGGRGQRNFARKHDVLFRFSKTDKFFFDGTRDGQKRAAGTSSKGGKIFERDGKRYQQIWSNKKSYTYCLDEDRIADDVWTIQPIPPHSKERLGYPTQKPIELYKRIIKVSSNPGDVILDPFAGCGTTAVAAEQLNRQWIGIDLTYLAIGAVKIQIEKLCPQIRNEITIIGTPEDANQALELARGDHEGFQGWCISHILKFQSNAKKGADGGIDGRMKFPVGPIKGKQAFRKAVAQVKGGKFTLSDMRDFRTAMNNENADIGVFVAIKPPTKSMKIEIVRAGFYQHPFNQEQYPKLQYFQIQDYFDGKLPKLPSREKIVL